MVYRKRGGYKKAFKKRSYRRPKQGGWGSMAKKALNIATKVASIVNTEYKFFDINTTAADHTYNGTIITLASPTQGVGVSQRTGDSIKVKNLTFRGEAIKNATEELLRLIIFIDKENTIASGSDLLQSVGNTNVPFSPKSNDNRYDSKILFDRIYKVTTDNPINRIDFVLKINEHLHFNAASATVDRNSIKMAVFSQSATNGAKLASYTRITYVDN